MPELKRLQFSTIISAPTARVWSTMLNHESYQAWASVFCEGSYYEGSWEQGKRIRFLTPSGEGMIAEIAESRPQQFISIRHLGEISKGIDGTDNSNSAAWAGAYENYTFKSIPGGTQLIVDQDVIAEYEQYLRDTWPKALEKLKKLCESDPSYVTN